MGRHIAAHASIRSNFYAWKFFMSFKLSGFLFNHLVTMYRSFSNPCFSHVSGHILSGPAGLISSEAPYCPLSWKNLSIWRSLDSVCKLSKAPSLLMAACQAACLWGPIAWRNHALTARGSSSLGSYNSSTSTWWTWERPLKASVSSG